MKNQKKQWCFNDNEQLWAKNKLSGVSQQVISDYFQEKIVQLKKEWPPSCTKQATIKWWDPPTFRSSHAARYHLETALHRVFCKKGHLSAMSK